MTLNPLKLGQVQAPPLPNDELVIGAMPYNALWALASALNSGEGDILFYPIGYKKYGILDESGDVLDAGDDKTIWLVLKKKDDNASFVSRLDIILAKHNPLLAPLYYPPHPIEITFSEVNMNYCVISHEYCDKSEIVEWQLENAQYHPIYHKGKGKAKKNSSKLTEMGLTTQSIQAIVYAIRRIEFTSATLPETGELLDTCFTQCASEVITRRDRTNVKNARSVENNVAEKVQSI